jgi:hypothetical protein
MKIDTRQQHDDIQFEPRNSVMVPRPSNGSAIGRVGSRSRCTKRCLGLVVLFCFEHGTTSNALLSCLTQSLI